MPVKIETLSETTSDDDVLISALLLALALRKSGEDASSASVLAVAERLKSLGEGLLARLLLDRLPALAEEFDDLIGISDRLLEGLSALKK